MATIPGGSFGTIDILQLDPNKLEDLNTQLSAKHPTFNAIVFNGDSAGDTIIGATGTESIFSGQGDGDVLQGGIGTQFLIAGNGNGDVVNGGTGVQSLVVGKGVGDVINGSTTSTSTQTLISHDVAGSAAGDTLIAGDGTRFATSGNADQDVLFGGRGAQHLTAGNGNGDSVFGGHGTQVLQVGSGNGDSIQGGQGTQTLIAGSGAGDTLDGGGPDKNGHGHDTFVFHTIGGADVVNDFVQGTATHDIVEIEQFTVNGFTFTNAKQLAAHANMVVGGTTLISGDATETIITISPGHSITIHGLSVADLTQAHIGNFIHIIH